MGNALIFASIVKSSSVKGGTVCMGDSGIKRTMANIYWASRLFRVRHSSMHVICINLYFTIILERRHSIIFVFQERKLRHCKMR